MRAKAAQLKFEFGAGGLTSPLHATFQGGKGEPFHDWYPYLEGFSSEFVRHVLGEYLPDSKFIIEPFAGVGTTPIVLAQLGVDCGYCEVNPAMRLVIDSKIRVGMLRSAQSKELAEQLQALGESIPKLVLRAIPDRNLNDDFARNFGENKFFDESTYDVLLRLRTVVDELGGGTSLLGHLATVAVMAKIVTCSFLKRAGDVRYKTDKEMDKGIPDLVSELVAHLKLMSIDCEAGAPLRGKARVIATNARSLARNQDSTSLADGVITSPPYLNGTNYFRNTKLELWFARFLSDVSLRSYRDEAITSGINDVGASQGRVVRNRAVRELVDSLAQNAYDKRIPRMAAAYFEDMTLVLDQLRQTCREGSRICIDIGDSRYGGVHVPTHDLLVEVAGDVGLVHVNTIKLRSRLSKDKSELSQSLVVLEKPKHPGRARPTSRSVTNAASTQLAKWEAFKQTMPHQQEPYRRRNWGSSLHSVCSYQAKMKPALAHHLVEVFSLPGQTVVDPFSGSGTIPYEACLMGRNGLGMDISLLGTAITNAKVQRADHLKVERLISDLEKRLRKPPSDASIEVAKEIRFNGALSDYFHPATFQEILAARDFFLGSLSDTAEWYTVFACMLHILHGNRPYALSRRSHPITPYAPTGPFEHKSVVDKLRTKVSKTLAAQLDVGRQKGRAFLADIRQPWPDEIQHVNAIITSPPFFDSTRFYMTNWMRFWFCGWSKSDFDSRTADYVESLQKKSLDIYSEIFDRCVDRLEPRGFAVFHLGYSHKCDMASELAARIPRDLEIVDVAVESVDHCESHGIRDKGTTTGHQYLILQRH